MYGEGNSARLLADIVSGTTQVTEGISAGMGIDIKSLLAGMLGGKLVIRPGPADPGRFLKYGLRKVGLLMDGLDMAKQTDTYFRSIFSDNNKREFSSFAGCFDCSGPAPTGRSVPDSPDLDMHGCRIRLC